MRVAIIPARGGSRRIPRKNIREFHGKPIIAYPIEAALAVFDQVWVSTEDREIAGVVSGLGALVLYRPQHLALDTVGTQEVMKHAVNALLAAEVAACIYPCTPFLRPATLRRALALLAEGNHEYIVPIGEWLRDPGQFYVGRAAAFRRGTPLISPETGLMQIEAKRAIDINIEADWCRAEEAYAELQPYEKVMA